MYNPEHNLKICFALKINNVLYSEKHIIENLDTIKQHEQDGSIDIINPDGALSIQ